MRNQPLRLFAARETIGFEPHGCANSRYAEGRFFVASNKLATLNAVKPGACPGKQGAETGMGCEAHRFASSRYAEGRFFAARGAIGFEPHGRAGGHYAEGRFFAARETIGSKPHGCANSRYAEGRFFVANIKLAPLNAAKPGACPGKQGEETGRRRAPRPGS